MSLHHGKRELERARAEPRRLHAMALGTRALFAARRRWIESIVNHIEHRQLLVRYARRLDFRRTAWNVRDCQLEALIGSSAFKAKFYATKTQHDVFAPAA